MDSRGLKRPETFQFTMECIQCVNSNTELTGIHYSFKFFTKFEPTLISITIYLTPRLKIMYFPKGPTPEVNLYLDMIDSPDSMKLIESQAPPSATYFAWKEITTLPPSLINKPLTDIVDKINSLKVFF